MIRLPLQAYLYRKQALNKSGMNTPYTLPVLQHAPSKRVLSCGKCDNVFGYMADVNTSHCKPRGKNVDGSTLGRS